MQTFCVSILGDLKRPSSPPIPPPGESPSKRPRLDEDIATQVTEDKPETDTETNSDQVTDTNKVVDEVKESESVTEPPEKTEPADTEKTQ